MAKCDCCGKEINLHYDSYTRVLKGVQFNVCSDCVQYLNLLNADSVSEESQSIIQKWATTLLGSVSVAPAKITAFRDAIYSKRPMSSNSAERMKSSDTDSSANHNKLYDINEGSGSVWTFVSKVACFFLVLGFMVGGGAIGNYISYHNKDGGAILIGVLIGLVIGLVVVSGHMMLVDMVDNIADSKRYLKSIRKIIVDHYAGQDNDSRSENSNIANVSKNTWVCTCGSEQPLTNTYCSHCGKRKDS